MLLAGLLDQDSLRDKSSSSPVPRGEWRDKGNPGPNPEGGQEPKPLLGVRGDEDRSIGADL
jgi:hypothetical protein